MRSQHKERNSAVQLQCLKQRKTLLEIRLMRKEILTDAHTTAELE